MFTITRGHRLIECCMLPESNVAMSIRMEEMQLLVNQNVAITKRLNLIEVDRMIACTRHQPPQCVIAAKEAKDVEEFRALVKYLHQRQRAGVGILSTGQLLLFIPIADQQEMMHCMLMDGTTDVNTEMTTQEESNPSSSLSPTSRDTYYTIFRQQHAAFNATCYQRIQEWSTK